MNFAGGRAAEFAQGLRHRADDELPHGEVVVEPHLALGGMDVHVHARRVHFEEQHRDRVAALHQRVAVALQQAEVEGAILDRALVDEEQLLVARGAADARLADEAAQAQAAFLRRQRHDEVQPLGAEDRAEPALESLARQPALGRRLVGGEGEADFRSREAGQEQDVTQVGRLGRLRAQEFAARGQVVKERADLDLRAGGEADLAHLAQAPAVDHQLHARQRLGLARAQAEFRDRRDARDGFAAEAVGADVVQVARLAQLAGGVALQAEQRVVLAHAAAVVGDGDEAAAARADLDVHLRRAGVERVFQQLLQHRRGPLDHLARRDLVGDLLGQQADAVHRNAQRSRPAAGLANRARG